MRSFSERNPIVVGSAGVIVLATATLLALQYRNLPFINAGKQYSAYFTEVGGLTTDSSVQVSGFDVGKVSSIEIDGAQVLVKFRIDDDVALGDRTEAAIKAKTALGSKILAVNPRGTGQLSAPIPADRTTPPYQLPDALGDLAQTISGIDTSQLSDSFATLAQTFSDTPQSLKTAMTEVGRISDTIDKRDNELRALLANANKATAVLSDRSSQIVELIGNTNALLAQLRTESASLENISRNLSALSKQLSGFVADNRGQLHEALDKLSSVIAIVQKNKQQVQKSLVMINAYEMSLGEAASAGPFFKAYIANLPPGQFAQPFIDAAFSDLGLDPNVLLPSQRTDPQIGQRGTPPLPLPYPRTGQGGEPNLKLPDAITGNPGDHPCPLPGPGCYPYREPLPAPPPGGPPPGPPASVPPAATPTPVYQPAPGEVPPSTAGLNGSGQP